ncbi:MAG TPA: hypothetical protein ACFE0H_15205 [Elainellaceae cyanobacterium]
MADSEQREVYQNRIRAELEALIKRAEVLNSKPVPTDKDAKIQHYYRLELLNGKQKVLNEKLEELQEAGESTWDNLRAGFEIVWDDFRETFNTLISEIEAEAK